VILRARVVVPIRQPPIPDGAVLQMATLNGARALGLAGQVGELARHAFADLIALPFAGNMPDLYRAIIEHRGPVAASMIDGRWAIAPREHERL